MRAGVAEVFQQGGVGAAGVLEGVGQDGQILEMPLVVDVPRQVLRLAE